eukprot:scaffold78549_cov30-Phaeocystis_antarctica.AAC.1
MPLPPALHSAQPPHPSRGKSLPDPPCAPPAPRPLAAIPLAAIPLAAIPLAAVPRTHHPARTSLCRRGGLMRLTLTLSLTLTPNQARWAHEPRALAPRAAR